MLVAIPSRERDEGILKSHQEREGFQGLSAGMPTL